MDANDFFEKIENAKPNSKATWSVTTTNVGAEISWEWDVTLDGHKYHDYIIPVDAMKDDALINRHLDICKQEMQNK